MKTCFLFVILVICCSSTQILAQSEEDQVIQTIQRFFDAMADKDTVAMKDVLLLDGQFYAVRGTPDNPLVRRTTHRNYIEGIATNPNEYLETMKSPVIHLHGNIAMVWTNYDFFLNNEFSHTGVDAFSLIKTNSGWKIAGVIYTVEQKE